MTARFIPPLSTVVLTAGVGFGVFAFSGLLEREIDISPLEAPRRAASAGNGQNRTLPSWQAPDPTMFSAIVTAPLFAEDRRMPGDVVVEVIPEPVEPEPAPEPVQVVEAPPAPLNYTLIGVMIADGQKKALLANAASGEQVWVTPHDKIATWAVKQIAADHVVVTNKGIVRRVELHAR
jgi:hypothetical protein